MDTKCGYSTQVSSACPFICFRVFFINGFTVAALLAKYQLKMEKNEIYGIKTLPDKLNLLGMLWYHGSKSQREAESCLESCSGDGCYMVREYKGLLYLSARYKDMYSHTPIPHTQQGYVLERHHNAFRTLQELISHHQKHVVYVDGGEFRLETSCHKGVLMCIVLLYRQIWHL